MLRRPPRPVGTGGSKLVGTTVYNQANENIGEVADIVIGSDGVVSAAIMSVGISWCRRKARSHAIQGFEGQSQRELQPEAFRRYVKRLLKSTPLTGTSRHDYQVARDGGPPHLSSPFLAAGAATTVAGATQSAC